MAWIPRIARRFLARSRRLALVPLATLAALAGCRSGAGGAPGAGGGNTPADSADVVATVAGKAIRSADVKRQAESAGTDARTALQALVDAELLAAEAAHRGLTDDPDVRDAARREMVRRLLRLTFETEVTPAVISDYELRRAYLRHRARLDHPEIRIVDHVLAQVRADDPPERKEALRRRAQEVAARARGVRDLAAFKALGEALSDTAIPLKVEQVATAREGWTVQEFADAAWGLEKVGDTAGPVESKFGFHVLFLEQIIPQERISYEQARENLRSSLWPELRRREFRQFVDKLLGQHPTETHAERLADATEIAGGETAP